MFARPVFQVNTIQMLQKEDWSFAEVGSRKRKDRALQVGLIGAVLGGLGWVGPS
jgi:hypothetical protein